MGSRGVPSSHFFAALIEITSVETQLSSFFVMRFPSAGAYFSMSESTLPMNCRCIILPSSLHGNP
jgi:hypothetical protein